MVTSALRNALILHGTCDEAEYFDAAQPAMSHSHWMPWLQKQLLIEGIHAQTPEMPKAYSPDYPAWRRELDRHDVDEHTLLVGFSCGAGCLLRWLSENRVSVARLVLVAPWLDPERSRTRDFFDFTIDARLGDRVGDAHLIVSGDDHASILRSSDMIEMALPFIRVHRFDGCGHFTFSDLGSHEFLELRDIALAQE